MNYDNYENAKEALHDNIKSKEQRISNAEDLIETIKSVRGDRKNSWLFQDIYPFFEEHSAYMQQLNPLADLGLKYADPGKYITSQGKAGRLPNYYPALLAWLCYKDESKAREFFDRHRLEYHQYVETPNLDDCPRKIARAFELENEGLAETSSHDISDNSEPGVRFSLPTFLWGFAASSVLFGGLAFSHIALGAFENIFPHKSEISTVQRLNDTEAKLTTANTKISNLEIENKTLSEENATLSETASQPVISEDSCTIEDAALFKKLWPTYGQSYCSRKSTLFLETDQARQTAIADYNNLLRNTNTTISSLQNENNRLKREKYNGAKYRHFGKTPPPNLGKVLVGESGYIGQEYGTTFHQRSLNMSVTFGYPKSDGSNYKTIDFRAGQMESDIKVEFGDYIQVRNQDGNYFTFLISDIKNINTVRYILFEG